MSNLPLEENEFEGHPHTTFMNLCLSANLVFMCMCMLFILTWLPVPSGSAQTSYMQAALIQGDHSGCVKPPVDIITKVAF